jgi:hypothetical protein
MITKIGKRRKIHVVRIRRGAKKYPRFSLSFVCLFFAPFGRKERDEQNEIERP